MICLCHVCIHRCVCACVTYLCDAYVCGVCRVYVVCVACTLGVSYTVCAVMYLWSTRVWCVVHLCVMMCLVHTCVPSCPRTSKPGPPAACPCGCNPPSSPPGSFPLSSSETSPGQPVLWLREALLTHRPPCLILALQILGEENEFQPCLAA